MYRFSKLTGTFLLFISQIFTSLFAQRGDLFVRNFSPHEYQASANNSGVCQNDEGYIFVANNNGVLVYDGRSWEQCKRPDEINISAVGKTDQGKIVAGTIDGDFALIEKDAKGKFKYTSLREKLPKTLWSSSTIRQIVTVGKKTYFLSAEKLVEYSNGNIKVFEPESMFHARMLVLGQHVFVLDAGIGFKVLLNDQLNAVEGTSELANQKYFCCYALGNNSYAIGFRNLGFLEAKFNASHPEKTIFNKREAPSDKILIEAEVNNGCLLRNGNFVVTSNKLGAFELNKELQIVRRYNTQSGVYENNIKGAFQDANGNLWLALYYGIAYVELNTNLYHYTRMNGINGLVQSATYFEHQLLLSTDKGVQFYDSVEQKFKSFKNFDKQSWFLFNFGNKLLVGTAKGLYSYTGNDFQQVGEANTFFLFRDPLHSNILYAGTENGLEIYRYNNEFELIKTFETNSAVRSIASDAENKVFFTVDDQRLFYLSHDGAFKLDSVPLNQFLPSEYFENFLFRFGSQLLIGGYDGIYQVVENEKSEIKIGKHPDFGPLTHEANIFRANQYRNGIICSQKYWNASTSLNEEKITWVDKPVDDKKYSLSIINHLNKIRPNFINYDSSSRMLLIAADEGLFLINDFLNGQKTEHRLILKRFQSKTDTLLENASVSVSKANYPLVIPYEKNDIQVVMGFTGYEISNLEFSYKLEKRDKEFQRWTSNNVINLSNLREGEYLLSVRARSETADKLYELTVPFVVLSPWYRTWWAYLIYLVLFAAFVIIVVRLNSKRLVDQNRRLEETIKERTSTISNQKEELEHKQQEILDSINYAQRIQRALLASDRLLSKNLKDYFVFFKPKDVVSGDFYWAAELEEGKFVLVTADSTGHGVPGAIMSMLNISCLTEAIEAKALLQPQDILNATRNRVIQYLANDGSAEGGKDGMDCSLISFDFSNKKLCYAAANNPIWIVRNENGSATLLELSCDKMPVGKHDKDKVSFTQKEVDLKSGDMLYALTDGFPDQFGGPKGKKFMYKRLKEVLLNMAHLDSSIQRARLEAIFSEWQGSQEQVDDVTLIGVRIR